MSDRDRAIEHLLRARTGAESTGDSRCLSADTVAAWVDGTLAAEARASATVHVAECPRCREVLAAVVLTEPEPEPVRTFWSGSLRWLVPLAAGATAAALWVAVPEQQRAPETDRLVVSREGAVRPRAESSVEAVQQAPESAANEALATGKVLGEARERAATEPLAAADEPAAASQGGLQSGVAQGRQETATVPDVALRSQAPAASPPPGPARANPEPKAEVVANGPGASRSAAEIMVEPRAFADRLDRSLEIVSADQTVRWRLGSGGVIERSGDGGATWQARPTGVEVDLLAGSAPTPLVCWLVGRSGTVVLTTDAETWRQVPFPERVDLVGVEALDGERATVTAADDRRLSTTDSGVTWTEAARP